MASTAPGWYDDGSGTIRWWDGQRWTESVQPPAQQTQTQTAPPAQGGGVQGFVDRARADAVSGQQIRHAAEGSRYVVLQVVLKEKMFGSASQNLIELENVINGQAALGYRLHTITTSSGGSTGFGGGDRIQATLVFEKD